MSANPGGSPEPCTFPLLPDFASRLRPGDRVGLGSEPRGIVHTELRVSAPGFVSVPPGIAGQIVALADQPDVPIGASLGHTPGQPNGDHLATVVPEGSRLVAVALRPEAARIGPFLDVADRVGATVALEGRATLVLRDVPVVLLAQGSLAPILSPERAERRLHDAFFAPMTLSARLDGDERGLGRPGGGGGPGVGRRAPLSGQRVRGRGTRCGGVGSGSAGDGGRSLTCARSMLGTRRARRAGAGRTG